MPVRVFKEEEKEEIRERLLDAGFPLLKEHGLIHMSIPKIASAAGIGTGTFYRFFKSKEEYLCQMILRRRKRLLDEVITKEVRDGKRKLSREEVRQLLWKMVDREKSVYANLDLAEEAELLEYMKGFMPDLEREKQAAGEILRFIEKPKEEIDFPVLANLMKVLVLASQARTELHKEGYERTVSILIDAVLREIYF